MNGLLGRSSYRLVSPLFFSVMGLVLLLGRMLYVSNTRFVFMAWNLILAWLPVLWSMLLVWGLRHRRWMSWSNMLFSALWLIFLPNSFYVITDFIHLGASSERTLLFDSVMILNFALAGILTGCISIYLLHQEFARRLERDKVVAVLLSFFLLNGLAIFLGRNLRWNSWDIIINPFLVLSSFVDQLSKPELLSRMLGTTMLFFVFVSVCYCAFYYVLRNSEAGTDKNR